MKHKLHIGSLAILRRKSYSVFLSKKSLYYCISKFCLYCQSIEPATKKKPKTAQPDSARSIRSGSGGDLNQVEVPSIEYPSGETNEVVAAATTKATRKKVVAAAATTMHLSMHMKCRNNACLDKVLIKSPGDLIFHACSLLKYWAGLQGDDAKEIMKIEATAMLNAAIILRKLLPGEERMVNEDEQEEG